MNDKTLHGNQARIDPKKKISPLLQGDALSDYNGISTLTRPYRRVGLPDFDEVLSKQEVDNNEQ